MSKKEILKPFDLDKAKNGAKLKTASGLDVRIICYDRKTDNNIKLIALVTDNNGIESSLAYTEQGHNFTDGRLDIKIVEEIEEPDRWRDRNEQVYGYVVTSRGYAKLSGTFLAISEPPLPEQASVVDAYVKLMQIIEHDARFGGFITAEEWRNPDLPKFALNRGGNDIKKDFMFLSFRHIAFHKASQRDLFLEENEDLIKKFFML